MRDSAVSCRSRYIVTCRASAISLYRFFPSRSSLGTENTSPTALSTISGVLDATRDCYRELRGIGDFVGALKAILQIAKFAEIASTQYTDPAGHDDPVSSQETEN